VAAEFIPGSLPWAHQPSSVTTIYAAPKWTPPQTPFEHVLAVVAGEGIFRVAWRAVEALPESRPRNGLRAVLERWERGDTSGARELLELLIVENGKRRPPAT